MWRLWKHKQPSADALVVTAIVTYYLLFNSSFYWWKAGLTFGPRYAGAAIPMLCLGLAVAWQQARLGWRRVLIVFALCSMLLTLVVVSTSSQLAMQDSCPILHSSWPAFLSGHVATNHESMLTPAESGGRYGALNLGLLMGLPGWASWIPLLTMWAIVVGVGADLESER